MTNYMMTSDLIKSATSNKQSVQFIKRIHFSRKMQHHIVSVSSNNAVTLHLISKIALVNKQILSINCKY